MNRKAQQCGLFLAIAYGTGCATEELMREPGPEHYAGTMPGPAHQIRTGTIVTATGLLEIEYEVIDGNAIVEGDIVIPWSDFVDSNVAHAATVLRSAAWPGGVVPYVIDAALPQLQRDRVNEAISHWHMRTAIRLVPRTTETDFVQFVDGGGCSSFVGRIGGQQNITLNAACSTGNAIHEIGHAVGLWHEQSRQDRDYYVNVNWENIQQGMSHNFSKYSSGVDVGAYDFDSIMHYGSYAFSANGLPTIVRRDGGLISGQRNGLGNGDLLGVKYLLRQPNTSLTAVPAICRTAPARSVGGTLRRADVAEVWAEHSGTGTFSSFAVHPSTGSAFDVYGDWARLDGGFSPNNIRWSAGDFDGDGDQDLVAAWNDAGANTLTIRRSSTASFNAAHWLVRQGPWAADTQWLPGDFNGDGRTDLISVRKDSYYATFDFWRSTGAGFAPPVTWAYRQGGWSDAIRWNVADFNLDGRDDILATWPENGGTTFTVRLSNNGSLTESHWLVGYGGWASNMQFLVGEFDGTGGPDVMVVWNDGGAATFTFYRNQGSNFAAGQHWTVRDGGWSDSMRWRAGDFDADGRDDVLAVWNDGGMSTLTVRRWNAAGYSNQHWGLRRATWQGSTDWCVGTFDSQ